MAKRKPSNVLKFSKKPSLKRAPALVKAEKKVKERKKAEKAAAKRMGKKT